MKLILYKRKKTAHIGRSCIGNTSSKNSPPLKQRAMSDYNEITNLWLASGFKIICFGTFSILNFPIKNAIVPPAAIKTARSIWFCVILFHLFYFGFVIAVYSAQQNIRLYQPPFYLDDNTRYPCVLRQGYRNTAIESNGYTTGQRYGEPAHHSAQVACIVDAN